MIVFNGADELVLQFISYALYLTYGVFVVTRVRRDKSLIELTYLYYDMTKGICAIDHVALRITKTMQMNMRCNTHRNGYK